MLNLSSLNRFNKKDEEPTQIELAYYLFWEKGISLKELNGYEIERINSFTIPIINKKISWSTKEKVEGLPLPYIFTILKTHKYIKKQEEEAYNKAKKK